MDLIEQWFGISPDGGDGSLEMLWLVAFVATGSALIFRRRVRAWIAARTQRRH